MPPEKRKPEEEPEAAKSPAVSTHEVTQPSAPPPTQATSSEGASGSPERADKSDVHGTKAGAENANEEHDARENYDGEEAKMKTQHRSLVTRENQVKAGTEEDRHPVKEALKDSPNHDSQSPEVTSKAVSGGDEVNDSLKSLTKRLSAALLNVSGKEDFVNQHSKVAEEAVAGWEKAENEVASLKLQLEVAVKQNSALEDRVSHLDGALKECVRQLRQLKGDISNAKDGLSQEENELLEAGQIINELQNEKPELYILVEDLTGKSDDAKVVLENQEKQIFKLHEDNDHRSKEIGCLCEVNQKMEAELSKLHEEAEKAKLEEERFISELKRGREEDDEEDEEYAQDVEAGEEDDEEDVEDDEEDEEEDDEEDAEDEGHLFMVYYGRAGGLVIPFERHYIAGAINLDDYSEIDEVDQAVWEIIFNFFGTYEGLFCWYIRLTEDDDWEYLSRYAWLWPWDRFYREAHGVVVTHQDPEPHLYPALGDIMAPFP